MTIEPLLTTALAVVRDPEASERIREIAVDALQAAVDRRLELPGGVSRAMWELVRRNPSDPAADAAAAIVGELADAALAAEVVAELRAGADDALFHRCVTAAVGVAIAPHVNDATLLAVAERRWGRRTQTKIACSLIVGVADQRTIDAGVLASLVSRWATSPEYRDRAAALEIADAAGALAPEVAEHLVLDDASPVVRGMAASRLAELLPREAALSLLERALARETHRQTRQELLTARAELEGS